MGFLLQQKSQLKRGAIPSVEGTGDEEEMSQKGLRGWNLQKTMSGFSKIFL